LLQGILNSFDGYCIRGENGNVLLALFRAYRILRDAKRDYGKHPTAVTSAWYGIENSTPDVLARELVASFIRSVIHPDDQASVIGFKEIRYMADDFQEGEFADYMRFLDEQFPNSCFIFNSRNHADVKASKWWTKDRKARRRLAATEALMTEIMSNYAHKSIWLRYEDYTTAPESLRSLAEFLGEAFDLQRVEQVLQVRHSY
jgi:hypothetical protein